MTRIIARTYIALLVCCLAGCKREAPLAAEPTPSASLRLAEYLKLGVPTPDSAWGPAELNQTLNVLMTLAQRNPSALPRYNDPESGPLFARIVSHENWPSAKLPLDKRMPLLMDTVQVSNGIFKIYMGMVMQGKDYRKESTQLYAFMLELFAMEVAALEEFWQSLPEKDRTPVRIDGIRGLRKGLDMMAAGALLVVADRLTPLADRRHLLARMRPVLPPLAHVFTPGGNAQIQAQLETLAQSKDLGKDAGELLTAFNTYAGPRLAMIDATDRTASASPTAEDLAKVKVEHHAVSLSFANDGKWRRYKSSTKLFSVELPSQPSDTTVTVPDKDGKTITVSAMEVKDWQGISYGILVTADNGSEMASGFRKQGNSVTERKVTWVGHPVTELLCRDDARCGDYSETEGRRQTDLRRCRIPDNRQRRHPRHGHRPFLCIVQAPRSVDWRTLVAPWRG